MRLGLLLCLALPACVVRARHGEHDETDERPRRRPAEDSLGHTDTATGTATASGTSTASGTATDTGSGAAMDQDCDTTPIVVETVTATPSAAPWVPGGETEVVARLRNRGTEDFFLYPGATVRADNAGVTTAREEELLYGLFAGQAVDLPFLFTAATTAAPGTVTFTAHASGLGCRGDGACPPPCPVTTTLDLVAPGR